VIAKAEWTQGEANPRFLVTSFTWTDDARYLYEDLYCARGDTENRIKECQTDMFAGRTSAASKRANQLRLWFAAFAYVLICALRRIGLTGTAMAVATCGTSRLKLLKIGAYRDGLVVSLPEHLRARPGANVCRRALTPRPRRSSPTAEAAHVGRQQLLAVRLTRTENVQPERSAPLTFEKDGASDFTCMTCATTASTAIGHSIDAIKIPGVLRIFGSVVIQPTQRNNIG
jgi:hypothetical protein